MVPLLSYDCIGICVILWARDTNFAEMVSHPKHVCYTHGKGYIMFELFLTNGFVIFALIKMYAPPFTYSFNIVVYVIVHVNFQAPG